MIAWKDTKLLQDLLEVFWYYRGPPPLALLNSVRPSRLERQQHKTVDRTANVKMRSKQAAKINEAEICLNFFLPRPINYQ